MKKNLANIITLTRIIAAFGLFFVEPLTKEFFIIYAWCGISDVLDGFIARTLKITSPLGSRLDSISDLCFYTIMMFRIKPHLNIVMTQPMWALLYGVLGIRLLCYLYYLVKTGKLISRHSIYNKITGFGLFLLPFMLYQPFFPYYAYLELAISYAGTIDEIIDITKN